MLRTLLNFFLIGGLIFGAKVFVEGRRVEGPEITVVVQADATQAEVEKTIQEAILLNEARRYGWDRHDPIVFTHLVRNMRFVEPNSTFERGVVSNRIQAGCIARIVVHPENVFVLKRRNNPRSLHE
jgi:hypothetical protein